jgi:hypothetical protein
VIVIQNSACGRQSARRRSSRLLTLPSAQHDSQFLIANLELEFRASARKQTADAKSNRKYSAISCSGARRVYLAPIPCSADGCRNACVLIGTLGISEKELSCTKERRKQNPNRDKIAFSGNSAAHFFCLETSAPAHRRPIISASAPLSSAPNLAIIDFPVRGHL